jgi:hypothetical protein
MWAQGAATDASFPTAVATFLIGGVVFLLGHRIAVSQRANRDYKTVKAAVKPARKAFWVSVGNVIKFAFWVSIAGLILIAWVIHDILTDVAAGR